ncbi:hypothetical protein HanXRQr2_Chr14g0638281 [Helianthus annuus]|uniref:Uncharacterized protein n=1 Tax=Helianthus annuus TaxID=4232 RepID=A0A9K3E8K2_HELAN|nr:hypothetical protein HanXRQr2_Chr14g0638281 [Helianthus annuus]KAJ0839899.1 hypothetical protein HanPSC8_Chr14g0612231 [Helianthus annuus]
MISFNKLPHRKRGKEIRCPFIRRDKYRPSRWDPVRYSTKNKLRTRVSVKMRMKGPINTKPVFSCF